MKLTRKSIGRIAASFVATAMLATMAIVPASAATTTPGGMDYTSSTVTFDAIIDMASADSVMPNGQLSFTLSALEALPQGHENEAVLGSVDDVATATVSVNTTDAQQVGATDDYSVPVVFTFENDAFENVGIYYYKVQQNDSGISGMTEDTSSYILKVYVENVFNESGVKTGVEIANVTMYKEGSPNDKVGGIEDQYATESLKLTKMITGDAANMSEKFSFTIELTDPDAVIADDQVTGAHVTTAYYRIGDNEELIPVEFTNGTATITLNETSQNELGNNEYITVVGLPAGTDYTITETDGSDYQTSWNGASIITEDKTEVKSVDGDIADGENAVVVTNNKSAISPTGIMMDIAPYAVLVVIAAAGCFIFLRKRHAKED